MSIHFVTGKLGAGKGLVSVGRIKDYLSRGLPVATNLDINLHNMFPKDFKNQRLIRIPDLPTAEHMKIIGYANKTYDEKKNGLLVFDECGTWFNSRSFKDKGRKELIDWLIHARKYGWDVLFQVQDFSLVDKQAREALGEHVVYCKRTDRMPIPFVGFLLKTLFDYRLPMPKVHVGSVTYGVGQNAPVVDRWVYAGTGLYSCYDTKQIFSSRYPHAIHSVLPGWYTHRNEISKKNWLFIMRLTKIYFKKVQSLTAFVAGLALTFCYFSYVTPSDSVAAISPKLSKNPTVFSESSSNLDQLQPDLDKPVPLVSEISPEVDAFEVSDSFNYEKIKLNYLKSWDYKGRIQYRILWNGSLTYIYNFPHRIEINQGELYAYIPY